MSNSVDSEFPVGEETEFRRGLGLFDATMIGAGAMIGSGIFLVSADMGRLLGSPGWLLLAWVITGLLTMAAALSYGELAAMMPRAGGQYVYLREAFSPLWGFLYGWTFILVIQAGTIAAVAVAFARFAGVLFPWIGESPEYCLLGPWHILPGYAISLSTAQAVGLGMLTVLTVMNTFGIEYGKWVQNFFTVTKIGTLLVLIVLGLTIGLNREVLSANLASFWTLGELQNISSELTAATAFGMFVALVVSQTGSLFSAEAWHSATVVAGEVREPRRNVPLAVALGTGGVLLLYLLANVAYLAVLPFPAIQHAKDDRVGTAMLETIFPGKGAIVMASAIMISTFGCNNGLILVGARASYAMARDRLFFRKAGELNKARVPGWGLALQGIWAGVLVLPRTVQHTAEGIKYGNLYGDLLDYVVSAALLFYVLTIAGLFRLRQARPDAYRPYRAWGYPIVPAIYIVGAATMVGVLAIYRPMTTWPGFVIVLLGVPMYYFWSRRLRND